jgi:GST-like protein
VFETGAILIYLAEKTGQFLPEDLRGRMKVMEWLFWQVGGLGPMLGQHGHFKLYAPDRIAYATNRYRDEALRLYGVLERQLVGSSFLAGEAYSIADMACWPWVRTWKAQDIPLDEYPAVHGWYDQLKQRPGLRRGVALGPGPEESGAGDPRGCLATARGSVGREAGGKTGLNGRTGHLHQA